MVEFDVEDNGFNIFTNVKGSTKYYSDIYYCTKEQTSPLLLNGSDILRFFQWYIGEKLGKELVNVGCPLGSGNSSSVSGGIYQFEGVSELTPDEISNFKELVKESVDEVVQKIRQTVPSYKDIYINILDYTNKKDYSGMGKFHAQSEYGNCGFVIVIEYGESEMTDYTSF